MPLAALAENALVDLSGLADQPALAHAGVAQHAYDASDPLFQVGHQLTERAHLGLSADHFGVQPFDAASPGGQLFRPENPVGGHRFGFAFDLDPAQFLDLEQRLDQLVSVVSDLNCARHRSLLHTGGQVDGVAQRGVLHAKVGAHRSNHHQAGVDTHPHVEVHPISLLGLLAIGTHVRNDIEACQNGPLRVILVGDRSAKERQQSVTH